MGTEFKELSHEISTINTYFSLPKRKCSFLVTGVYWGGLINFYTYYLLLVTFLSRSGSFRDSLFSCTEGVPNWLCYR